MIGTGRDGRRGQKEGQEDEKRVYRGYSRGEELQYSMAPLESVMSGEQENY
jgi:hypothetical protein